MASAIAIVGVVVFVIMMVFFHNVHKCFPQSETTNESVVVSPNIHEMLPTPTESIAISIVDDSPIVAPRDSGKISFIRFSGFTDSDASSISERSTGLSFWSALALEQQAYEVRSPSLVQPPTPPPQHKRQRPYIPRLGSIEDPDGVYTVKIVPMKGMAARNLLAYKPPNPRPLKTKQVHKHARIGGFV